MKHEPITPLNDPAATRSSADYRPQSGTSAQTAYRDRLVIWTLRVLSGAGGMPVYRQAGLTSQGALAELLGVPELADVAASSLAVSQAIAAAVLRLGALNQTAATPVAQDCGMLRTVNWLAQGAGLDPLERDIFEFAVAACAFTPLRCALASWSAIGHGEAISAVAGVLQVPSDCVANALQARGRLLSSGLLKFKVHFEEVFTELLYPPRRLVQSLPYHEEAPALILGNLVVPMPPARLSLSDFTHLQHDIRLAHCWLAGALHAVGKGEPAGHLLISGAPGLGKTECVRAWLQAPELTQPLSVIQPIQPMELVVLQDDGNALSGEERLSHLRLALSLLRQTPGVVLVFDEADDVFRSHADAILGRGDRSAVSMANHRASLNRLLETSRLPVVWIMNHPEVLDPAVLRRFDAVLHVEPTPRSVRLAVLQARLPDVCGDTERGQWADVPDLTPALIDRLAVLHDRARAAGAGMDAALCRHWLRQRLPGKATRNLRAGHALSALWNPQLVNASADLVALAQGIARSGTARILLHGAPGTGKTAYAHELARRLDRPLSEQRASDLLSAWVGETEQHIAQVFATALQDGAVLFLDEADSLLADRAHALHQWEVSQVNELLEHLGEFEGVVVLATNRLSALDNAVLRRLDVRIRFDALTPEQVGRSFVRLCQQLQLDADESAESLVVQLADLTPGDFALLARRHAFAPFHDAQALAAALQQEAAAKPGAKPSMGFWPTRQAAAAASQAAAINLAALF